MLRPLRTTTGRLALLGLVAAAVVAVPTAITMARPGAAEPEPPVVTRAPPPTTTTTTTALPPPPAPLTGWPLPDEHVRGRPALVVKVDNVPRARPQAGLAHADVVIEERVEGNVTRFVAVFHSQDAPLVGPVRSARTTDLELTSLLGRVLFASSGGNNGVMAQIRGADLVDVGNNVSGRGFHRSGGRPAPHDLMASSGELRAKAPEQPGPPRPLFSYRAEGEPLHPLAFPLAGIRLAFGGPEVSRFHWSPPHGTWQRWQSGTPHLDIDGVHLAPRNVVVLGIDYDHSGQLGRSVPHGILTGEGPAVVLTAGHAIEGRWVRFGLGDSLRLLAHDGSEIRLTPGQTFVALPPKGSWGYL
jgi:hypothetical protein